MLAADATSIWVPPAPAIIRPAEDFLLRLSFWPGSPGERRTALRDLVASKRIAIEQANQAIVWFSPVFFAGKALAFDLLTAVETAANSLTCPAVKAGDLLVFVDSRTFSIVPAAAVPSGFTLISNTTNTYTRTVTSYKVATGTEGGTSLSTMVQVGGSILLVFRPTRPGSVSVGPVSSGAAASNGAIPAQTIAVGSAKAPIVMIAACGSNFTDNPNLNLSSSDGSFNGGLRAWAAYRIQNKDLLSSTVSVATNNRTRTLNSFYLQVS